MDQPTNLTIATASQAKVASPRASRNGSLTCQQCQTQLTVPVDTTQRDDRLYVTCPCGMQYEIIAGSRRYKRKAVQLPGTYQDVTQPSKCGDILVDNLSFGGLRFRTQAPHTIARRDHLQLQFVLDDGSQTCITEPVKVRYVNGNVIGARFSHADSLTPALAAYLIR